MNGSLFAGISRGNSDVNFQEFTASGTWIHPSPGTLYLLYIMIVGGGGGGGSGAISSDVFDSTAKKPGGGSGGNCGEIHIVSAYASLQDEEVIVGTTGAGGASATYTTTGSDYTDTGNSGSNGGTSSFGPFKASGGQGGNGGPNPTTSTPTNNSGTAPLPWLNAQVSAGTTSLNFPTLNGNSGSISSSSPGGARAYGGDYANDYKLFSASASIGGGNGDIRNNASSVPKNGEDATSYGGGGSAGGGSVIYFPTVGLTLASGAGGKGGPGLVRVWAWRA